MSLPSSGQPPGAIRRSELDSDAIMDANQYTNNDGQQQRQSNQLRQHETVLESVPTLPALQENRPNAAHHAPPRRVSISAATNTRPTSPSISSFTMPATATATATTNRPEDVASTAPICLRIVKSHVPLHIRPGIEQLALHAPRRNIILVDHVSDPLSLEHLAAFGSLRQGATSRSGAQDVPVWWWNVVFAYDAQLPSGTLRITKSSAGFSHDPQRPFVVYVHYVRPCEAFRGLGHILGVLRSPLIEQQIEARMHGNSSSAAAAAAAVENQLVADAGIAYDEQVMMKRLPIDECATFETMGTMIDCSRNGVLLVKTLKYLLKKLAMMGYNMLQLYTEDTYNIEGEPFFGYLRGGYSFEQLKEIDDYAFNLGIEVVPCIQTLGHLGQMLQWPRFLHLRDTSEVLLADAPETYVMLRKMINAATKPFRSKKIHLGMDETHGLGYGRYHTIFGHLNNKDPTRIFIDHLARVNAVCQEMGLQPCIWSDMLFCLNARNNSLLGYYDSTQPTTSVEGIPPSVELVYWDYYHTSQKSYTDRINSHLLLSKRTPWMAGGSWTWSRFWTALPFTFATNKASMNACKQRPGGVKNVFLTIWGDEGNEVDVLSSLPAWSYYAEHGYEKGQEVDLIRLRSSFDGICAGSFDDFVMASRLDDTSPEKQTVDDAIHFAPNTSKWLLWEEPAFGFVSPSMQACGLDLEHHFTALAAYLEARLRVTTSEPTSIGASKRTTTSMAATSEYPLNARLRFPYLIAKVLSYKSGLRYRLHLAYIATDWVELERLGGLHADSRLSRLRVTLRQLSSYHRQMWMSTYSPFGWETVELRYGGLAARLETLQLRIARFLTHIRRGGHVGVSASQRPKSMNESGVTSVEEEAEEEEVMLNPTCGEQIDGYEEEVTSIAELAQPLQIVYGSADQLLDYHRVSRVTYC